MEVVMDIRVCYSLIELFGVGVTVLGLLQYGFNQDVSELTPAIIFNLLGVVERLFCSQRTWNERFVFSLPVFVGTELVDVFSIKL